MTKGDGKIQVVIADDHRMFRYPLRLVLERSGECEVIGEAASAEEAVALTAKLHQHVIILDIGMPGMGGIAAAHRIAKVSPASKVLMLSQYDDEEYVLETLTEAGAAGYLLKTDAPEELLNAVRAVYAGKSYLSPSIAPILLNRITRPRTAKRSNKFTLTRREREVLKLVGDGATSKDIALKLDISPKTAQVHRDNLKQKLNLRSTAAMVRYAIKHKIVKLD
jgi:DNA-binding NarL/FixJ family response regulator